MNKIFALVVAALLLCAPAALAQETNEALLCPDEEPELSLTRYARGLSLDLRGVVPTVEEMEAVRAAGELSEATLEEWLEGPEFTQRVIRKHRELLWNNVTNVNLWNAAFSLGRFDGAAVYWRRQPAAEYRGDTVPCDATVLVPEGADIVTTETGGLSIEGYRNIEPYWAPGTTIPVCAFDAQENPVSPTGTRCDTQDGSQDPGCGCGPNLSWCRSGAASVRPIVEAFGKDVELRIADVIDGDRSYLDLFTGQTAYVNGPLVHYWKHHSEVPAGVRNIPVPLVPEQLPDLAYTDVDTWHAIQLGPEHAGLLTSPAFLLRFQTGRARANRFFNAFMCQPFQPPSGGLPTPTEESAYELDLQLRDGCKYCHALLEPSASYWGRWRQEGAGYLEPGEFPALREDCERCATTSEACSADCKSFYLTSALVESQEDYLGMLLAYEFRREDQLGNVESGPRALALSVVVDGRLPDCVSRTAATWLLGRDILPEEEPWVDELSDQFIGSNFRYRTLIKNIVSSPVYRSVQ